MPIPYAGSSFWRRPTDREIYVSQYVGQDEVGLYIRPLRGGDPQALYDELDEWADRLTETLGTTIGTPGQQYLYVKHLKIDMKDHANWDQATDWLSAETELYETTLRQLFCSEPDG